MSGLPSLKSFALMQSFFHFDAAPAGCVAQNYVAEPGNFAPGGFVFEGGFLLQAGYIVRLALCFENCSD